MTMPDPQTIYLEIPLDEFERLHARIRELEDELLKAYSERDAAVTELRGYLWGMSNMEAEQRAFVEGDEV